MQKLTVPALLCALALGACQALPFRSTPAPVVDAQGTVNAIVSTASGLTAAVQASPTQPPTSTETASPTPVLMEASPISTIVNTDTPVTGLVTLPATGTAVASPTLVGTAGLTSTPTVTTGQVTASATMGIRTYGTLPPQNRPYTTITILNRSKAEAYISLQIETDQGYTIIEYPVKRFVKVSIPTGNYTYVVWVGGRQFVGYFHAYQDIESVITIYKDKILID